VPRSRIEFRVPEEEKLEIQASAAGYGLSLSLYLRALALEDREAQERAELRAKCYPDKAIGND
jgi:hypothetical protein